MRTETGKIRAFIAIELPDAVKEFLEDISSKLKQCRADVNWVRPERIHLTLKFLGSVSTDLVPVIQERLLPVFSGQRPISLQVARLGAFPGLARPRVIWAGLDDPDRSVGGLASSLEQVVEPLGFKPEQRPFRSHLTLGRVRSNRNAGELMETVRQFMDISGPSFVAGHAVLFESVLKPSGAEYFAISRFVFARS